MARDIFQAAFFGCQRPLNPPRFAHTWAVLWKSNDATATFENAEHAVISWLPRSGRIRLKRPPAAGKNFSVSETRAFLKGPGSKIKTWGPFRVHKKLYELALERIAELESGRIQFVVLDNDYRPDRATNCIHALSDLGLTAELLNTGVRRGFSATQRVVKYFADCGMILSGSTKPSAI
jgi:hypothetical protein